MTEAHPEHPTEAWDGSRAPSADRTRRRRGRALTRGERARRWSNKAGDLPLGIALALSAFGCVLAVGGVHVWVLIATLPFAIAAGIFAAWRERWTIGSLPTPALVLGLLALYCLLQAIPVPF